MKDTDFCPTCKNYLYLMQVGPPAALPLPAGPLAVGPLEPVDSVGETLRRVCRNCGYQAEDKKGGLILEFDL